MDPVNQSFHYLHRPDFSDYFIQEDPESSMYMPPSKRQRKASSTVRVTRNYQRYPKPPYSYVGMIIAAIETTPDKSITLKELNTSLQTMFDFFNGSYTGWKDSVRHTLSHSPCFIRTSEKRNSASIWKTDLTKAPTNVFKRQDTDVSKDGEWAPTLIEQLNIANIQLPTKECPFPESSSRSTPTTSKSSSKSSKSPDFNFSIDNILADIVHPGFEHEDDSRRRMSFSNDSPVFTQKTISLTRSKKQKKRSPKTTQKALAKLIADQAATWGISQDQAISNLSLLCSNIPAVTQTTSSQIDIVPSSPASHQQSSPSNISTPPSSVTSAAFSPVTPTTQASPTAESHLITLQPFTQQYAPVDYHPTTLPEQSYYTTYFQEPYYTSNAYPQYTQGYDQQQPSYLVDTSRFCIEPLNLSTSPTSTTSSAASDQR